MGAFVPICHVSNQILEHNPTTGSAPASEIAGDIVRSPQRLPRPSGDDPANLRTTLTTRGIAWYRFPQAGELAADPRRLARELFGPSAVGRVDTATLAPAGNDAEIARSSDYAPLHTDELPILPAHAQVMVCHEQAESGGESIYLDTRVVLEQIAQEEPELLERLFTAPGPLQPVFSWRNGCLVCGIDAIRNGGDSPRDRFAEYIDRATPIVIRAEPGDVVIIDNHRFLHGRRGFSGRRHFTRLLCWLNDPLEIPEHLADRARMATERVAAAVEINAIASWARSAVVPASDPNSASRLAAVIACLAGEPETQVADELGIARKDLRWWIERVMGAGLSALDGNVGQDATLTELRRVATRVRLGEALHAAAISHAKIAESR